MKKGAKLNTAFTGFGPLSPNSKQIQHERALALGACCFENEASTALRQTQSCSHEWTSREARQEEEGGAHQSQQIVGFDWQGGRSLVASAGVVGVEQEVISRRGRMGCS
jgi:hypothetical protein